MYIEDSVLNLSRNLNQHIKNSFPVLVAKCLRCGKPFSKDPADSHSVQLKTLLLLRDAKGKVSTRGKLRSTETADPANDVLRKNAKYTGLFHLLDPDCDTKEFSKLENNLLISMDAESAAQLMKKICYKYIYTIIYASFYHQRGNIELLSKLENFELPETISKELNFHKSQTSNRSAQAKRDISVLDKMLSDIEKHKIAFSVKRVSNPLKLAWQDTIPVVVPGMKKETMLFTALLPESNYWILFSAVVDESPNKVLAKLSDTLAWKIFAKVLVNEEVLFWNGSEIAEETSSFLHGCSWREETSKNFIWRLPKEAHSWLSTNLSDLE